MPPQIQIATAYQQITEFARQLNIRIEIERLEAYAVSEIIREAEEYFGERRFIGGKTKYV